MQKRVLIYGTLAFISIIAISLKINHIKKDLKKVNETPCEFEPGHQLNLNDLANQLNFVSVELNGLQFIYQINQQ